MAEICFDTKKISKESIFDRLREADVHIPWMDSGVYEQALRILLVSLLRCVITVERSVGLLGPTQPTGNDDSRARKSKQSSALLLMDAGDRRWLGMTAETRRRGSCAAVPIRARYHRRRGQIKETSGLCFSLFYRIILARRPGELSTAKRC